MLVRSKLYLPELPEVCIWSQVEHLQNGLLIFLVDRDLPCRQGVDSLLGWSHKAKNEYGCSFGFGTCCGGSHPLKDIQIRLWVILRDHLLHLHGRLHPLLVGTNLPHPQLGLGSSSPAPIAVGLLGFGRPSFVPSWHGAIIAIELSVGTAYCFP